MVGRFPLVGGKVSACEAIDGLDHQGAQGWHAHLHLGFRGMPARTVLAERERHGPLSVQRALYPEGDLCHVYLLHPPGGVAGGDSLDIQARMEPGASALVTTPGATKFYRSTGALAIQRQILKVEAANLEWLPQENILFPGANAELSTRVELVGDARFIGWEINCLGRPVVKERFDRGRAVTSFSLLRDGLLLLHERLMLEEPGHLVGAAGLRGRPVVGTFYATFDEVAPVDEIRESLSVNSGDDLGITLVDGVLLARYLGDSTERARNHFIGIWEQLRTLVMGRDPHPPRIWST
ncbi:MAG: hypothetical protein B0D84_04445 [Candidatus Sedimenticola endophacoides]|uniref:Urease accessory protein UreD n=1 Tax=Candidatus Sedimenticola endophacoides TaxID=2548426 RepID=A0A657PMH8_9GAMM|nr:MAG: hypothetical protein B0D84_04445 [Candidatus Sedimenticola endophacoides]